MTLQQLQALAEELARERMAPLSAETDQQCRWPATQLGFLGSAGLMGLHVPQRLGGHGQGLLALAMVTESLAKVCPSTSMCFGMHCVGTAVIAAKATAYHEEKYLKPIAEGRHVTSLSLSETGTGSNFYIPETLFTKVGEGYQVKGRKSFVTSGGHADSYVLSGQVTGMGRDDGEFSCLVVDRDTPGLQWGSPWAGFGMRGNSSLDLLLNQAEVPLRNLLGDEGDQIWYVFEVVAPYFLMAMSGTYLGIGQACLDLTLAHLRNRRFAHSGETLADFPVLQSQIAEMWIQIERIRQVIYEAGRLGDLGDPKALPMLLASKAEVAETAVAVANQAMTLGGGMAYAENSHLSRLLRDARAAHVMAPTTHLLKQWLGRSLLGLPIL